MNGIAIDLFAGAGGWDLAAEDLGQRVVGVELDDAACATRRAAGLETVQADIAELDPVAFARELIAIVVGLIASPPCPTFSSAGSRSGALLTAILVAALHDLAAGTDSRAARREEAHNLLEPALWAAEIDAAEKRGREPDRARSAARARRDADMSMLVVEPLRWALALRPEWIALEQVPAVLPLWSVMAELLGQLGYSTATWIIECERHGVPQTRERAILIASRTRAVAPARPTHQRYVKGQPQRTDHTLDGVILPWRSMAQALNWGMTERPSVTVAAKPSETGGRRGLAAGTGASATIAAERERGAWIEGPEPAPAPTVSAGGTGSGGGVEVFAGREARERAERAAVWLPEHGDVVVRTNNFTAVSRHADGRRSKAGSEPYERSASEPAPTVSTNVSGWTLRPTHMVKPEDRPERVAQGAGNRPRTVDEPATTLGTRTDLAEWVFERPATTIACDPRVHPPGHKVNADDIAAGRDDYEGRAGKHAVRVTVEEAAVLQSFPPDYPWQGTRGQQFTQVGNAFPVLAARAVLETVVADAVRSEAA